MDAWIIWAVIAAVLVIIEVLSQMMWALCLAIGCIAALIASLAGLHTDWQLIVLVIVSLIAYVVLLPGFKKRHAKSSERIARTGMDALLGRHTTVTEPVIPGNLGRARIDGDNWQIKAGPDTMLPAGTKVVVTGYDSIILNVEPLDRQ